MDWLGASAHLQIGGIGSGMEDVTIDDIYEEDDARRMADMAWQKLKSASKSSSLPLAESHGCAQTENVHRFFHDWLHCPA